MNSMTKQKQTRYHLTKNENNLVLVTNMQRYADKMVAFLWNHLSRSWRGKRHDDIDRTLD